MHKPNILIACVNFNTYDKLHQLLISIEKAWWVVQKKISITVLIGDNSQAFQAITFQANPEIEVLQIKNGQNLGYLGGVAKALEASGLEIDAYDFFVISNVDVSLDKHFFANLLQTSISSDTAWLAPAILSEKEKRDRNPAMLTRPSLKRLNFLILMFRFMPIYWLYKNLVYNFRKKKIPKNNPTNEIYAGHGSFMLFTKAFTKVVKKINFPAFLYGEEIYFAELVRRAKQKVVYVPVLKIYDFDHVNTSKIALSVKNKMQYDALRTLKCHFFNN